MKFVWTTCLSAALTMMFASGCVSQTAARQETETTTSQPLTQGSDTKGSSTRNAPHPGLLDPKKATEQAPEKFQVKVATTQGDIVIDVTRKWSPNGADRFYNLVKVGYLEDIAIFRAVKGFMFQFGIHGDPAIGANWSKANIKDDPQAGVSNKKGYVTFAKTGAPDSRSTQMFINLGDNSGLDNQGFTPFGQVAQGMDVVEKINTEYGENPRHENIQGKFKSHGNKYIMGRFPNLDIIKSVTLIKGN